MIKNKNNILTIIVVLLFSISGYSQDSTNKELPSVNIKTMDGKVFNTSLIYNDGKPIILSFWATWCKPCIKELTTIAELYSDWQKETGVKIILVSVDDSRTTYNVKPFVEGNDWSYEVFLDANSDFKRAMNVNLIPHTFVLNGKGQIVWQHTSFTEGAEIELINIIRKIIKGEPIDK
ncbi:MAG: TlpA disulfide reductase family protein [Bacteroidales bacterium]|nr:TlpA disulfide reductase family protein [Bacteroidales bacterium]